MSSPYSPLPEEIRRAKWPHEIFLINLVFNHIFLFATTFGNYSTFPWMVMLVPGISLAITLYIFVKARYIAKSDDSLLIKAHWASAERRNRQFVALLLLAGFVLGGGYLLGSALGWTRITMLATLGGFGLLPFMVAVLVLVVMGNFAMYEARHHKFPKGFQPPATL